MERIGSISTTVVSAPVSPQIVPCRCDNLTIGQTEDSSTKARILRSWCLPCTPTARVHLHRIEQWPKPMCGTGLMVAPAGNIPYLTVNLAAIGFFIYGPQMLIGLIGAEVSHPRAVGTGNGLLGWIAYIGAAMAGEPVAHVVKSFGWGAYASTLCACCVGALPAPPRRTHSPGCSQGLCKLGDEAGGM